MESHNNDFGKTLRNLGLIIGVPVLIAIILWMFMSGTRKKEEKIYTDYVNYFKQGQVEKYDINLGGRVEILLKKAYREDVNRDNKIDDKDIITYVVPNVGLFLEDIDPYVEDVPHDMTQASQMSSWLVSMLPSLLMIGLFVVMWIMLRRSFNNLEGGGKMMGFGKAHVKQPNDESRRTTFEDVAGADEEKEELQEIVEFLRSPKRFKELGARVPKGVLLVRKNHQKRLCFSTPEHWYTTLIAVLICLSRILPHILT